jgi:hypothetical protein
MLPSYLRFSNSITLAFLKSTSLLKKAKHL